MIIKQMRYAVLFILALLFIATSIGSGGSSSVRSGSSVYYDMHYRNPWHGHSGAIPPPHYIGPPPIIIPPDIPDIAPPVAVPLPM